MLGAPLTLFIFIYGAVATVWMYIQLCYALRWPYAVLPGSLLIDLIEEVLIDTCDLSFIEREACLIALPLV